MKNYDDMEYRRYTGKAEYEKALLTLRGILQGITIDNIVNQAELLELENWVSVHEIDVNRAPFNELIPLIKESLADGVLDQEEIEDIIYVCDQFDSDGAYYNLATLSMQLLHGIFHGLLSDFTLSDQEIRGLSEWLQNNEILTGMYPYDEIRSLVASVLSDGVITEDERNTLIAFMGEFIDCRESYNISQSDLDALKEKYMISGICALDPDLTIENKVFCFTGKSSRSRRDDIANAVEAAGGIFKNSVVKNTDFLIVGDEGNPCWAFSCYGRKVEKAVELRKSGSKIQIVHENDFWDAMD